MDHTEEEGITSGHLRAYMHCAMAISFFCFVIFQWLLSHRDTTTTSTSSTGHTPPTASPDHHVWPQSPLLSFSFIFHVICEDSSPSYACINQGHLVLYNVLVWVISSLGQQLSKVLKLALLQPSRYWLYCYYSSDSLLSSHYLCSSYLHSLEVIHNFITRWIVTTILQVAHITTRLSSSV